MNSEIQLSQLLQNNNYPSVGTIIYDKLITEEKVVIDCSHCIIPPVLLNSSIGRFIDEHSFEELDGKVLWKNVTRIQACMISDYITNWLKK